MQLFAELVNLFGEFANIFIIFLLNLDVGPYSVLM